MDAHDLDLHFEKVQELCKAPDIAFGIAVDGDVITSRNTSTQFRIASMSKSFTAAAVLMLRDRGLLALDDTIASYVPELHALRTPTSDSPDVTIRHLLTMSSGLANDDPWADRRLDVSAEELSEVLACGGYFATPVASQYVYCNLGYVMLGAAISNISGNTFQQFITSELLDPLEMRRTTWEPNGEYAMPFRVRDGKAVDEGLAPLSDGTFASMGGLWSTIDDLLSWTRFFLDAFPARDDTDDEPLCRASRREMQRIWTTGSIEDVPLPGNQHRSFGGYGMGLRVHQHDAFGHVVSHTGGLPGYGSNMAWLPLRNVAVVSMANVTYAPMAIANLETLEALSKSIDLALPHHKTNDFLNARAIALVAFLNDWDERQAGALFADNVVLDENLDRRRAAITRVTGGTELTIETVAPVNAAVADVRLSGANDRHFAMRFSVSSQYPPLVQNFFVTEVDDPTTRHHNP